VSAVTVLLLYPIPKGQNIEQPNSKMSASSTCYTIIHDDLLDNPNSQDLRNALQKGSDEVKLETMRRIIVGTLNGQSYVSYVHLARP
jgi:vesicle coat complex subunit